jgi:hypothetical protein
LRFFGKKQHWRVASNAERIIRRLQTQNLVSFCHIDSRPGEQQSDPVVDSVDGEIGWRFVDADY